MVNQATLARKISYVLSKIKRLKARHGPSRDDFLENEDLQDIVLHNLQLAIQGCIDLGTHIVTDEGWGVPGSFSEVFYKLEEHSIIPKELSERLVEMVGFRNRIIHDYEDIDLNIVYEAWHQGIKDIEKYVLQIGEHFRL